MAGEKSTGSGNIKMIDAVVYSDSIFKYLESGDGVRVTLNAIRGGKIKDITEGIQKTMEPDIVMVHVGTNDLTDWRTTLERMRRDYTDLLDLLDVTYGCPITVSAILPRWDRLDLDPLRRVANLLLSTLTANRGEKFNFMPWDDNFNQTDFFSIDGLHPSKTGNTILHQDARSYLRWTLSDDRKERNMISDI